MTNKELLEQCRACSTKIDLYFADESWRSDVEDEDSINEAWLAQKAASLILEELEDLGITTNLELDDLFLSERSTKSLLLFRRRFDYEGLREYLRSRTESTLAHVRDLLENTGTPEDLLSELVMYLKGEDPLNASWYALSLELDYWCSTPRLGEHLQVILNELDEKVDVEDTIEDTDVPKIAQMLGKINLIRQKMKRCYKPLCTAIDFDIEGTYHLGNLIAQYDHQLIKPDLQANYATVYDDPKSSLMIKHRKYTRHHVECWQLLAERAARGAMDGDLLASARIEMISRPQLALLALCAVIEEENPAHLKDLEGILHPDNISLLKKMVDVIQTTMEE